MSASTVCSKAHMHCFVMFCWMGWSSCMYDHHDCLYKVTVLLVLCSMPPAAFVLLNLLCFIEFACFATCNLWLLQTEESMFSMGRLSKTGIFGCHMNYQLPCCLFWSSACSAGMTRWHAGFIIVLSVNTFYIILMYNHVHHYNYYVWWQLITFYLYLDGT